MRFRQALVIAVLTLVCGAAAAEDVPQGGFAVPEVLSFQAEGQPPRVRAELINPFSKDSMTGALFEIACSDRFGRDVPKNLLIVDRAKRQLIRDHLPVRNVDFIREIEGPWVPRQKVTIDLEIKSETAPVATTCRALELWSVW